MYICECVCVSWRKKCPYVENNTYVCIVGDSDVTQFIENEHYNGTYKGFAPFFTAELFDPDTWAELFAKAGAKFV